MKNFLTNLYVTVISLFKGKGYNMDYTDEDFTTIEETVSAEEFLADLDD